MADHAARSPIYGVSGECRFPVQEAAGAAIAAITAVRRQHDRMMELVNTIGHDLGVPAPPPERAEELLDANSRLTSQLDQLEAIRRDLADLIIDAPAFVSGSPLYAARIQPELDELPVNPGGGAVTDLPRDLQVAYLLNVHKWVAAQNAKLVGGAVEHLRRVVALLTPAETRAARELQERCVAAIRSLGMEP